MGPMLKDTHGQTAPGSPEKLVLSESGELMELASAELQKTWGGGGGEITHRFLS